MKQAEHNYQPTVLPSSALLLLGRDDLLNIPGIDPAMEMALNSVGIRKFSDFLGHTPETLSRELQERAGTAIAATSIASQEWLDWAQLFANEKAIAAVSCEEKEENVAEKKAGEAMLEIRPPEPALSIDEVRFAPVEMPARSNATTIKYLRGEIRCGVAGKLIPSSVPPHISLCVQIHAADTNTGECKLLGSQTEIMYPGQTEYDLRVEFKVPGIGHYLLQLVAFALRPDSPMAFYRGPFLRVAP